MARKLPNLHALRAFEAAARLASFSRAADELCVTQAAISWHIKSLESHLGVPLFKRLARAVELTAYGREYLPVASDAFDKIEQATARLERFSQSRVLVVDVLPTFAMQWLIPRLPAFNRAHPNVEVHMLTSIRPVNFQRDELDVAIRVGTLPSAKQTGAPRIDLKMVSDWNGIHSDELMPDILVPVCSPGLIKSTDGLNKAHELLQYVLLHNATREHAWIDWFVAVGVRPEADLNGPSFGHFFMALQAAIEGHGIALVPRALAERDIVAGRLIVAFDHAVTFGAYHFLCRKTEVDLPAIIDFRAWLLEECK